MTNKHYQGTLLCASIKETLKTQSVNKRNAIIRFDLGWLIVITSILLTDYFLYNHNDASHPIFMNPKYKV